MLGETPLERMGGTHSLVARGRDTLAHRSKVANVSEEAERNVLALEAWRAGEVGAEPQWMAPPGRQGFGHAQACYGSPVPN